LVGMAIIRVCGKSLFLRARSQEGELEGGKNSLESGKVIDRLWLTPRYATLRYR
jgi:hypothetical protein